MIKELEIFITILNLVMADIVFQRIQNSYSLTMIEFHKTLSVLLLMQILQGKIFWQIKLLIKTQELWVFIA